MVLFHAQAGARQVGAGSAFTDIFRWVGYSPVDLLFSLSGFLIVFVHYGDIGRRGRAPRYWLKRLARVFPFYWSLCAILVPACFLLPMWTSSPGKRDILHIVWSLLLLPPKAVPLLGVTWTMSHELFFYAVFSVAFFRPRLALFGFGCWTGAIAGWNLLGGNQWPADFFLSTHNLSIIGGAAVALLLHRGYNLWRPPALLAAGLLLLMGELAFNVLVRTLEPAWPGEIAVLALSSTAIIAGLVGLDIKNTLDLPKWTTLVAMSSYAIYLVHYPVILVLQWVCARWSVPAPLVFPVLTAAGVFAGIAAHLRVEQPLYRMTIRFAERHLKSMQSVRLPSRTGVRPPMPELSA